MVTDSDEPPIVPKPKGIAAVILSREFRGPYLVFVGFLALLGTALFTVGVINLFSWWDAQGSGSLPGSIGYLAGGTLTFILALGVRQSRRYFHRIYEVQVAEIESLEFKKIDSESYDRFQQRREREAEKDYERNLSSTLVLERLRVRKMVLFPQADWNLQPGVNVLLGRNGYGKSLLLRTLSAVLQHDENVLKKLLLAGDESSEPLVEVWLRRNEEKARIRRSLERFEETLPGASVPAGELMYLPGKVPLLAIPDSRFIDRSQDALGPEDSETSDLRKFGAHHFINLKPYGSVVRGLVYEICLDYWEHGKNFDLPVFGFLRECVKRLTGYDFQFHSIERKGRTGFEVHVLTEGNEEPLPIQHASQGTLSVLAMFGLIRSYVRSLSPNLGDGAVQQGSAIVLIDEADAHLHPAWQQKFPHMLKDLFPNVQFILSAHSPLFVAGCWRGEVAVLRRQPSSTGFTVEQLDRDFVGVSAKELYEKIFEIEELDETYMEYAAKATMRTDYGKRIEALSERLEEGGLSEMEGEELRGLEQERFRIGRAVEIQKRRREESGKDARIGELESKILKLETKLAQLQEGTAP